MAHCLKKIRCIISLLHLHVSVGAGNAKRATLVAWPESLSKKSPNYKNYQKMWAILAKVSLPQALESHPNTKNRPIFHTGPHLCKYFKVIRFRFAAQAAPCSTPPTGRAWTKRSAKTGKILSAWMSSSKMRYAGADVINKFYLCWNKALWLVKIVMGLDAAI